MIKKQLRIEEVMQGAQAERISGLRRWCEKEEKKTRTTLHTDVALRQVAARYAADRWANRRLDVGHG